jgi:hypothetical protein
VVFLRRDLGLERTERLKRRLALRAMSFPLPPPFDLGRCGGNLSRFAFGLEPIFFGLSGGATFLAFGGLGRSDPAVPRVGVRGRSR